jgi:hypothetical protein
MQTTWLLADYLDRLRGGEPMRGHCVANPTLELLTSGMTKLHTHTQPQLNPKFGLYWLSTNECFE